MSDNIGLTNKVYVLSHLQDNHEEVARLNSQHEAIKHAILQGYLIHPSIQLCTKPAIADIGCGTGVWLQDVARNVLATHNTPHEDCPTLVGFDINAHAFSSHTNAGVKLIQHDCTEAFDACFHGQFDLVSIRGLAYALPQDKFPACIENAIQILKPGGYLEWLETETSLFRPYPETVDMTRALQLIAVEREARNLVPYLPHFMLQQFAARGASSCDTQIINFSLLPGGLAQKQLPDNFDLNMSNHLSNIMLESVKLLLGAAQIRRQRGSESAHQNAAYVTESSPEREAMAWIDRILASGEVKLGGIFPHMVIQKSKL